MKKVLVGWCIGVGLGVLVGWSAFAQDRAPDSFEIPAIEISGLREFSGQFLQVFALRVHSPMFGASRRFEVIRVVAPIAVATIDASGVVLLPRFRSSAPELRSVTRIAFVVRRSFDAFYFRNSAGEVVPDARLDRGAMVATLPASSFEFSARDTIRVSQLRALFRDARAGGPVALPWGSSFFDGRF